MLIPKAVCKMGGIASDKSTKYAIDGVLLERDKDGTARAVATDGRRLIVSEFTEPPHEKYRAIDGLDHTPRPGFSAIVSRNALDFGADNIPDGQQCDTSVTVLAVEECDSDSEIKCGVTDPVAGSSATLKAKIDDGRFPDWRAVVPQYKALDASDLPNDACARVGVNAELLAELLEALADFTTDEFPAIELQVPVDHTKPIKMIYDGESGRTVAALMPVNMEFDNSEEDNED